MHVSCASTSPTCCWVRWRHCKFISLVGTLVTMFPSHIHNTLNHSSNFPYTNIMMSQFVHTLGIHFYNYEWSSNRVIVSVSSFSRHSIHSTELWRSAFSFLILPVSREESCASSQCDFTLQVWEGVVVPGNISVFPQSALPVCFCSIPPLLQCILPLSSNLQLYIVVLSCSESCSISLECVSCAVVN